MAQLFSPRANVHSRVIIVGVVVLVCGLALLAWFGKFSHGNHNTVEIAGLCWHFVDVVWVFLFPLLYLVGHR